MSEALRPEQEWLAELLTKHTYSDEWKFVGSSGADLIEVACSCGYRLTRIPPGRFDRRLWHCTHLADVIEREYIAARVAAAKAEVEHWKSHAEEAGEGFTQVCKDAARISARNVELSETLARVTALVDNWAKRADPVDWAYIEDVIEHLRAALPHRTGGES